MKNPVLTISVSFGVFGIKFSGKWQRRVCFLVFFLCFSRFFFVFFFANKQTKPINKTKKKHTRTHIISMTFNELQQQSISGLPRGYPPLGVRTVTELAASATSAKPVSEMSRFDRLKHLLTHDCSLDAHRNAQRDEYAEFLAMLLLFLANGVDLTKSSRAKLLAVAFARRDFALAKHLLFEHRAAFGLAEVVRALRLLDAPRAARAVERKLKSATTSSAVGSTTAQSSRRVAALRTELDALRDEIAIGACGSSVKRFVRRWLRDAFDASQLMLASELSREPWRQLCDIVHARPQVSCAVLFYFIVLVWFGLI